MAKPITPDRVWNAAGVITLVLLLADMFGAFDWLTSRHQRQMAREMREFRESLEKERTDG